MTWLLSAAIIALLIVQQSDVLQPSRGRLNRPETLTHAVLRHMRNAVLRGEFAPGQALPEVPLAERLGVARGTLREALRGLADQGLVEIFPHRGAFVTRLTPRRAREIYTFRAELESYAVELAVERRAFTGAALTTVNECLATLEHGTGGDQFDVAAADMRFHELLCQGCDHRLLLDTLASLRLQALRFIILTKLMDSDLEPEGVTHRRLLDAVLSGDPRIARRAVHDHITQAGEQLLRKLPLATPSRRGHSAHDPISRPARGEHV